MDRYGETNGQIWGNQPSFAKKFKSTWHYPSSCDWAFFFFLKSLWMGKVIEL